MKNKQETRDFTKVAKGRSLLKYSPFIIIVIALFLAVFLLLSSNRQSNLDKILNQPEEEIDIAQAALIVAKEVFPDIDINDYLARLDKMASEIKWMISTYSSDNVNDPEYQIRCINTWFFYDQKYIYDLADFFGRKPRNCFLNGIMDTKKGACFTMPLLYLCLADRLDIPIYGVNVPCHFFLRYDDGHYRSNIEVTGKGGINPDEAYIEDFQILDKEIQSGVFMKNLSKKQIVSNIIEARGGHYARIKEYEKAIRDFKQVVELNPTNAGVLHNLGRIYDFYKHDKKTSDSYMAKCKELGLNFARKHSERDIKYIEHFIKKAKAKGEDTSELEALRDKELARQDRQWKEALLDIEKVVKANSMHRKKRSTERYFEEWSKNHQERQKATQQGLVPCPRPPNPRDNSSR